LSGEKAGEKVREKDNNEKGSDTELFTTVSYKIEPLSE
jgi:hypothetical protein